MCRKHFQDRVCRSAGIPVVYDVCTFVYRSVCVCMCWFLCIKNCEYVCVGLHMCVCVCVYGSV